jgi:glycosyltransferase involved in cell wall biosynthesis
VLYCCLGRGKQAFENYVLIRNVSISELFYHAQHENVTSFTFHDRMSDLMRILLLAIGPKEQAPKRPEFLEQLCALGNQAEVRRINETKSYLQIAQSFLLTRDIKHFDLVIATEYFSSFGLCLRSLISKGRTRVAVIGFNVSRRYLLTRYRLINRIVNRVFGQLSLIVVHSTAEQKLFSDVHDLDRKRFELALWGYDLPKSFRNRSKSNDIPFGGRRFICMIGRNNRDFETLRRAIEGTGIPAVFITSFFESLMPFDPDQIKVMYDLPFEDCLSIIQQSAISVTLLKDETRGAGHITTVSSMLLGKPQIFSDADVLRDYVTAGQHGIAVPIGDTYRVREAILELFDDEDRLDKYGTQARDFATSYLSNDVFQKRLASVLSAFLRAGIKS